MTALLFSYSQAEGEMQGGKMDSFIYPGRKRVLSSTGVPVIVPPMPAQVYENYLDFLLNRKNKQ